MKEEFERIGRLMNVDLPKPTEEQVRQTIEIIEKRFEDKKINMSKNLPVKEGYKKAIEVLQSGTLSFGGLQTIQGRAIAAIAFDYLNGECSQEVLVNVPLKSQF